MDKELFYEIILFAEKNGYKGHLGMLPVMPICKTSYEALAKTIFWEKRYEIIFSHEFAKAFFGDNRVHPTLGTDWGQPINKIYGSICKWEYILSIIVLEEDPFKYLKEYYEKIQSNRI